jgi:hypothetical protein
MVGTEDGRQPRKLALRDDGPSTRGKKVTINSHETFAPFIAAPPPQQHQYQHCAEVAQLPVAHAGSRSLAGSRCGSGLRGGSTIGRSAGKSLGTSTRRRTGSPISAIVASRLLLLPMPPDSLRAGHRNLGSVTRPFGSRLGQCPLQPDCPSPPKITVRLGRRPEKLIPHQPAASP